MIEGLRDRTKRDLNAITSAQISPDVFAPADRRISAWLGGSILTDISTFEHLWVTKAQWSQLGSAIIYRNCF